MLVNVTFSVAPDQTTEKDDDASKKDSAEDSSDDAVEINHCKGKSARYKPEEGKDPRIFV